MILKQLPIFLLSTMLTGLAACKKESSYPVQDINCSIDYGTHSKNETYQTILDNYTKNGIPGLTVIISDPSSGYWSGSSGYANIEDNTKMTPCNLHHTASLAKSFVGIIILQLIEEGKLHFDDKISPFLTEEINGYIPNVEQLTIKHLLQQTSGIPDVFDLAFFQDLMNNPEETYTNEDFLKMIDGRPAMFNPNEKHYYSDLNFNLLAMIIDAIEGNHFVSFEERIFKPLGLNNIYYHNKDYPEPKGLSAAYWDQYNNGELENISDFQIRITDYIEGSDGIISSPADMTRFYEAVFNGELIGEDMLQLVKTDWVKETDQNKMNTSYSHGFMVIETEDGNWIGHAGSQVGASCFAFQNLKTGTTISAFTNIGVHFFVEKKILVFYDLWNDLRASL